MQRFAAVLAAAAALAAPAAAQFDLLNWTFVPSTSGSGTLSPDVMTIVGPIGACVAGGKFVAYTAVAPFDGTVVVSADYQCGDESFDSTNLSYKVGAVTTLVSQSSSWSGQIVFDVPAGVVFGLSVGAHCSIGSGQATFTDFSFIPKSGPLPALDGAQAFEHFGSVLAPAGDLDGDGATDLIVGVPDGSPGGVAAGRVAVVSGDLSTTLLALAGAAAGDDFGFAVAGGEDLNGDGVPDLVVGSPKADQPGPQTDAGRIDMLSGADGSLLHAVAGDKAFDKLGFAVAFVGDIDGDGVADVAAGAPFHDVVASNAGQVLVLSGATGAVLLELQGQAAGERFGSALAGAGDIDGDGTPDFIVGAPGAGTTWEAGRVTVHSGADGSQLHAFVHTTYNFGTAVAGGGDFDGDGVPDVVGSAPNNYGLVNVHSGADGSLLQSFSGPSTNDFLGASVAFAGDLDGDGADELIIGAKQYFITQKGYVQVRAGKTGALLLVMPGVQNASAYGAAVACLGDVDGDGHPEVAAGAPETDVPAGIGAGRVRTFEPYIPWRVEGPGLAGAFGTPQLSGKGLVGSGAPNKLTLQGGVPHTNAALVAGLSAVMLPFKGGVLVPAPNLLVPGLVVDNDGQLALPFTWPAGLPSGFDLWLQMWIPDQSVPSGLIATNGLHAAAP